MSLGKMISEKRNRQRRVIEVPEWGDDDAPLLIYSSAITAGDLNKIQRKHKNFLNDMTVDGMVDLIIMKAQDVDGNKLFTLEDKIYLMAEDMTTVANIAEKMFGDIDTVEVAEKN
jgi:hypothetical protein